MPTPTKKTATKSASTGNGSPSTTSTGAGGKGVEYPVEAVDEMVEEIVTTGNKARYRKLLAPLMEQEGQLFKLAVFTSTGGARRVAGQFRNGKTTIPGEINDWEFTPRKAVIDDEGTEGSILYAKYLGEGNGPATDESAA